MKDPSKPMSEENWAVMDYEQFARFLETDEGRRRKDRFEVLGNRDDEAGAIFAEFRSKAKALEARRERYHSEYLRKQETQSGILTISLDVPTQTGDDGESAPIIELIPDENMDTEKMAYERIMTKDIPASLENLKGLELELVMSFYAGEEKMTENRYSKLTGDSRRCIHERHQSAIRKLRLHYRRKKLL